MPSIYSISIVKCVNLDIFVYGIWIWRWYVSTSYTGSTYTSSVAIKNANAEIAAATEKRRLEKVEYGKYEKDMQDTVKAISTAIKLLDKQPKNMEALALAEKTKFMLAQIDSSNMKSQEKELVTMLIQGILNRFCIRYLNRFYIRYSPC